MVHPRSHIEKDHFVKLKLLALCMMETYTPVNTLHNYTTRFRVQASCTEEEKNVEMIDT